VPIRVELAEPRLIRKAQEVREPGKWYVSYTVKRDDGSRGYARKTQTFATEELAKLFARTIAADNLRPTAGTINPYLPKKIISATDIATWLETPMQLPVSHASVEPAQPKECSSIGFTYSARSSCLDDTIE
jgi:hypothetical protein